MFERKGRLNKLRKQVVELSEDLASRPISVVSDISTSDDASEVGDLILTVKTKKQLILETEALKRLLKRKFKEAVQAGENEEEEEKKKRESNQEQVQDKFDEEDAQPLKSWTKKNNDPYQVQQVQDAFDEEDARPLRSFTVSEIEHEQMSDAEKEEEKEV